MADAVDAQATLEATLKDEIVRMYQDVADNLEGEFHFSTDVTRPSASATLPNGSTGRRGVRWFRLRVSATRTSGAICGRERPSWTSGAERGWTQSLLHGVLDRQAGCLGLI